MIEALVTGTGLKHEMARFIVGPIIRHLCSEYGGERLYIPSLRSDVTPEDIRTFFQQSGGDVEATCREFSISRRTLYRHLNRDVEPS